MCDTIYGVFAIVEVYINHNILWFGRVAFWIVLWYNLVRKS